MTEKTARRVMIAESRSMQQRRDLQKSGNRSVEEDVWVARKGDKMRMRSQ